MKKAVLILIWLLLTIPCPAEIIIVNDSGPADFNNIQAAIDNSNHGDIIYVFPGRYTGPGNRDIDFKGQAITVQSVVPEDPYIVAATIVDCNGAGRGFNFHSGEDASSILDGLTIANGQADYGGGIACYSSPTITNCAIISNASNNGGGLYAQGGRPTLANCRFTNNMASRGGGFSSLLSNLTIAGCMFNANSSNSYGGALACDSSDRVQITNCTFTNNSAMELGGGIWAHSVWVTIANSIFNGNSAAWGGGLHNKHGDASLSNCIFSGNSASSDGGAIDCTDARLEIANCTVSGNSATSAGGGIHSDLCTTGVSNSILWGNTDSSGTGESAQISGDWPQVTYSCIQDQDPDDANIPFGGADSNNIDDNPIFVRDPNDGGDGWGVGDNDDYGDLHLEGGSPCINAGDPYSWIAPSSVDIDGEPRVMGQTVDMGADEYPIKMLIVTTPEGGEVWTWGSWHQITWESYTYDEPVFIMYITEGNNVHPIATDVPNTGSYMWHLPEGVDTNECVVRVSPSVIDITVVCVDSGVFTIHPDAAGPAVTSKWESLGGDYDRRGLSENYGPELGCVKWAFETGGAVSASVTIGPNETTYVPCEDGKLYKLDSNGVLLWSYDAGTPLMSAASIGPDGTAYVGGKNGKVYAVDIDGNVRWTHSTEGLIYSSPAVGADGKLYVGSEDGKLYALGPDGSELWSFETAGFGMLDGAIFASPSVGPDGTVYIGGIYDPNLYALDPNNGNIKWVCHFESGGWPFASPVIAPDGTIYQTLLYDANLYAVKPDEPNAGSIIWSTNLSDTSQYSTWFEPNYHSGVRWDSSEEKCYYNDALYNDVSGSGFSEPVIGLDATIYVSFDDPYLRAVDPNGSIRWIRKLGNWSGFTLTVGSNGLIYAATEQGYLYVVKPNGDRLARFDSNNWPGFPVISADNTVIVSDSVDNTTLISYESNKVWAISADACQGQDPNLYWYGVEDLDGDAVLHYRDLALITGDWLRCTYCWNPFCDRLQMFLTGDINKDYRVNFSDYALLAQKWLMGY
ncbi:MAG TPA: PQQ-binding-like beta-propeller repeat protein [Sedimentisphaerales bacterium]|nr:PQQ-binding-like beta-propeller repeat protein [Sedimentisphaerales bacterium]